jgi:hypothetical protein
MSIVGIDGKPIAPTEGPTGRKIVIHEVMQNGKPVWGMDFSNIGLLEMFQVMGDCIRAVAQRERSLMIEKQEMAKVKAEIHKMKQQTEERT